MRILHLITSLHGGGTENFLWQIVSGSPRAHSHEVLYLREDGIVGDRLRKADVPVRRAPSMPALLARLRRRPPDVLHTLLFRGHQIGRLLGRAAGVPRVVSSQRAVDRWMNSWQRRLDNITLPLCSMVVGNSRAALEQIRARLGPRSPARMLCVPNAVDLDRFRPREALASRAALGWPAGAPIAGTLMRLHADKGADRILPWAAILLREFPDLHLMIGGVGPEAAGLERASRELPGSDRMRWLGWVDDVPLFMAGCDFFWLLSREESFPQTLLEASAMGLPWTAPDIGGVAELAAQCAAEVYREGDIAAAQAAARRLIAHLPEYRARARRSLAGIADRHGLPRMIETFYRALEACPPRRQTL